MQFRAAVLSPQEEENSQGAECDQPNKHVQGGQLCRKATSKIHVSTQPNSKQYANSDGFKITKVCLYLLIYRLENTYPFFFFFEGRKCVTTSLLKQESRPSTPELLTDKNDSVLQHPSPTDSPSPQPWESPNTIQRLKVRSYMSPTTSSRAKVRRSMSLKEGLHLNLSSGQTSPCPGSSPTSPCRASTPILPSLSTPLHGPCNPAEPRSSPAGCSPNPAAKITKARVSARMSNPLSEDPNRSTATPSTDSAAVTNAFSNTGIQHRDKCYTKSQVEPTKSVFPIPVCKSVKDSLEPKTSSHTRQLPLVAVQAYSVTSKSQSDQGLTCLHLSDLCTVLMSLSKCNVCTITDYRVNLLFSSLILFYKISNMQCICSDV